MLRGRLPRSPDARAVLLVVLAVVVANLPYLSGFSEADPLGTRSGLATAVAPGHLLGQPTIDPNSGFLSQALGRKAMDDVVHGTVPWWNPLMGTGAPLAGDFQSAAFFPPSLLLLLPQGQLLERLLLELVAALSTYALVRRLGVARLAAVPAGIAFGLNGTFAWFAHAAVNPVAFLPLALLGVELARARAREGRPGGWWPLAVGGALSLLGGFPETTYLQALLVLAWALVRLGGATDARRALALKLVAGAVVAAALCAPLVVAGLHFTDATDFSRRVARGPDTHLPLRAVPQLLLPYVHGTIFATGFSGPAATVWGLAGGYLTVPVLLLALVGLARRGLTGLRVLLAAWVVAAIALATVGVPGLSALVRALPGMDGVLLARYVWPTVELPLVVLAALGVDRLLAVRADRRVVAAGGAVALLVVGLGLLAWPLARDVGVGLTRRPWGPASVAWGLLGAGAVVGCALLPGRRARGLGLAAVVALDAIVLFAIPMGSAPREVRVDEALPRVVGAQLGLQRAMSLGPLGPNYGSYYGVATINSDDFPSGLFARYVKFRLDRYAQPTSFFGANVGGRVRTGLSPSDELLHNLSGYQEAAVSLVLTRPDRPIDDPRLTLAARTPSALVYRIAGSRPYWDAGGACRTLAATRTSATVDCARPATLVRRETALDGWRAEVDGRRTPIGLASATFQQVAVPAGRSRVTYAFAPPHSGLAWIALALGGLGLAVPSARVALGRRRRRPAQAGSVPAG